MKQVTSLCALAAASAASIQPAKIQRNDISVLNSETLPGMDTLAVTTTVLLYCA